MTDEFPDDILRPLSNDELLILLDLYKKHKPYAVHVYGYVLNRYNWNCIMANPKNVHLYKLSEFDNIFYTPRNGDLVKNGTFVSISSEDEYIISFFTLEISLKELRESINQTKRIKWKLGPLMKSMHLNHLSVLYDLKIDSNLEFEYERSCAYYWLSKEKAAILEYQLPDDVFMDNLKLVDAAIMFSEWPNRHEGNEEFIRATIEFNGGLGLYSKNSGKLVAWILLNEFYAVAMLQIIQSEQGKGYGKILTKAFCKKIALENKEDGLCFIVNTNLRSIRLFTGIGFRRAGFTNWIKIRKQNDKHKL